MSRIHRSWVGMVWAVTLLGGVCAAEQLGSTLTARNMEVNGQRLNRTVYRNGESVGVGRLAIQKNAAKSEVLGLRDLEVDVEPCGLLVRTTVKHVFYNETEGTLEGVFTFALPAGAVVDRFAMTIQSENDLMEGTLLEQGQAITVYRNIVYGYRRDPGVLEMLGPRTFRATIFPILPQKTKTIVLSYVAPLEQNIASDDSREWLFRYPLMTANGRAEALAPAFVRLRLHLPAALIQKDIRVSMDMQAVTEKDGSLVVGTQVKGDEIRDDWMVAWPQATKENVSLAGCLVQAHRVSENGPGSFLLRVAPPVAEVVEPGLHDLVVLWDTSANRTGAEMTAARACILSLFDALRPGDRFALVAFDAKTRAAAPSLLEPTLANRASVSAFLFEQRPLGATDISAAFEALSALSESGELRDPCVVYIGDGEASLGARGAQLDERVQNVLKQAKARLFSIWPGSGLTGGSRLALANLFHRPAVNLTEALTTGDMGAQLRLYCDSPFSGMRVTVHTSDGLEAKLLHEGSTNPWAGGVWEAMGEYTRGGEATVELVCEAAGGPKTYSWKVNLPETETGHVVVEKLLAHRRVAEFNANGDGKNAIELSLKHRVLCPQTAFLVLESEEMYREFNVKRDGRDVSPAEVRGRLLAGVQTSDAGQGVAGAPAWLKQLPSGASSTNSARLSTLEIDGTHVDASLKQVVVPQDQGGKRGTRLTASEATERRFALSAKIAGYRGLPFEPETVFPRLWIEAAGEALQNPQNLATRFGADGDAQVWRLGNPPEATPAATPGLETGNAQRGARRNLNPEVALWQHLLESRTHSLFRYQKGTPSLEVDSHQFAQHYLSTILYGRNPQWMKSANPQELDRAIRTRSRQTYDLRSVAPERLAAAWNFLAQLMLVECRPDQALVAVRNAQECSYERASRLTRILSGCASAEEAGFVDAAAAWQDLLAQARGDDAKLKDLLVKLYYGSAVLGGDRAQVSDAFELFGRAEMPKAIRFYQDLARMFYAQKRMGEAERALGSVLEFRPDLGEKDLDAGKLLELKAE